MWLVLLDLNYVHAFIVYYSLGYGKAKWFQF